MASAQLEQIDSAIARRLLDQALGGGGDYADLYFEYRAAADYSYEDEKVKSVGRGISLGLGVRVLKGEATGYAYCEDFTWEAMRDAAVPGAQIPAGGKTIEPIGVRDVKVHNFYPISMSSLETLPE